MKVLLATDGSDQAATAFRTAARLLRREDSEFDLLCVAPEFYFPKGKAGKTAKKTARMVEAYDRRIRAEARQHLINAQATLAALGVEAGTRVEVGSPARVIMPGWPPNTTSPSSGRTINTRAANRDSGRSRAAS